MIESSANRSADKPFDLGDIQRRLERSKAVTPNLVPGSRLEKRFQALQGLAPKLSDIGKHLVTRCREALRAQGFEVPGGLYAYLVGGRTKESKIISPSTDFDIVLVSQNALSFGEGDEANRKVSLADIDVKQAVEPFRVTGQTHLVQTSGVVGITDLASFKSSRRNEDAILLYFDQS